MSTIPSTWEEQAMWCSYMPALGYALAKSDGPVLEIGIGHFSTPFLHEYCKAAGRLLLSVEDNSEWRKPLDLVYGSASHRFGYSVDFATLDMPVPVDRFGVVFIDNSPGGDARLKPFLEFLDKTDYIVVHDYHRENEGAIKPYLSGVNHRIFNQYQPPTLLASKTKEVR